MTLAELYDTWFVTLRHTWFSQNDDIDTQIKEAYSDLLATHKVNYYASLKDLVASIILYDQVPRHIFRNCVDSQGKIKWYLSEARVLSELVIDNPRLYKELSVAEWMFVMLPLRHTQQQQQIFRVMRYAWERLQTHPPVTLEERNLYRSFMKATYRRCPLEQRGHIVSSHAALPENLGLDASHILQLSGTFKPMLKLPTDSKLVSSMKRSLGHLTCKKLILSISGGVDSMVMSYVIHHLRPFFPRLAIEVVHINYKNKPKCDEEEQFVIWWCQKLDFPIHVRRIHEIQRIASRDLEMRDIYESYTRNVRYNTYKALNDEFPFVCLGHNKDDCFENIFCGITHCRKYENLKGMSEFTLLDDIIFVRPFLDIPKAEIRAFARVHSIPHLYDSTPAECQRGRIRDSIVPTLQAWYPQTIESFFELSHTMQELYSCAALYVDTLCLKSKAGKLRLAANEAERLPELVWRGFISVMFEVQVSKGSLKNMVSKIRSNAPYQIILSKNLSVKKTCEGTDVLLNFIVRNSTPDTIKC